MQKFLLSGVLVSALAAPALADPQAPATPDPAATPAPASPEPAAAPTPASDGSASSATPAASATVEVKKEEPLRFYGFGLDYSIYDGSGLNATYYTNTLDQLFIPSWSFGKLLFNSDSRFSRMRLAGRWSLTRPLAGYDDSFFGPNADRGRLAPCSEVTPSSQGGTVDTSQVKRCDFTGNDYRWGYTDILLTISNPKLATIPVLGIDISPSITTSIPVSRESRFATLRGSIGAGIAISRTLFEDKLTLRYSIGGTINFHQYTNPHYDTTYQPTSGPDPYGNNNNQGYDGYVISPTGGNILGGFSGRAPENPEYFSISPAGANSHYGLAHIFGVDVAATDKLSFSVLYVLRQGFAYSFSCPVNYGNIQGQDTCASGQAVAANSGSGITRDPIRNLQIFWATAGYQVTDYLNVSVALVTSSPQRKPDGSLRQPFLYTDATGFSSVSVGATLSLEKAAAKLF